MVLVTATIFLAWWQWTRFRSGSGTFQNLGYALQWPFFGAFFVYAYRKFVEYENIRYQQDIQDEQESTEHDSTAATTLARRKSGDEADDRFTELLPQRQQLSVEEFNALNKPRRGHSSGT
ncbi:MULTISPECIES: hypothetical protein [unclassified Corynebacterium]|uniref:hypothetical protein n=1 Tax=unclassified Corynebacterium TaxID=2624378 RepID=UPI001FEF1CBD|nr:MULTISPECIES: hypothetical protein [unclassified Corynebacterium]